MPEITDNPALIAACGLYCGACKSYLKGKCPGCAGNTKASWCKVRACNGDHQTANCAGCQEFGDPNQCGKFNNVFSKVMAIFFNSNRQADIQHIRKLGPEKYANFMAARKLQTIPRNGKIPA